MKSESERKLYKCLRCGWAWLSPMDKPNVCAKCHSPYWDIPKKDKAEVPTGVAETSAVVGINHEST